MPDLFRKILAQLEVIRDYQQLLREAIERRDELILEALAEGATDAQAARCAGVSRAWVWKLRQKQEIEREAM